MRYIYIISGAVALKPISFLWSPLSLSKAFHECDPIGKEKFRMNQGLVEVINYCFKFMI